MNNNTSNKPVTDCANNMSNKNYSINEKDFEILLPELRINLRKLEEENQLLWEEKEDLIEKLKFENTRVYKLKKLLNSEKNASKSLWHKMRGLQKEIVETKNRLNKVKSQLKKETAVNNDVSLIQAENKELKRKVKELKGKIDEMKTEREEVIIDNNRYVKQMHRLFNEKLRIKEQECKQMKKTLGDMIAIEEKARRNHHKKLEEAEKKYKFFRSKIQNEVKTFLENITKIYTKTEDKEASVEDCGNLETENVGIVTRYVPEAASNTLSTFKFIEPTEQEKPNDNYACSKSLTSINQKLDLNESQRIMERFSHLSKHLSNLTLSKSSFSHVPFSELLKSLNDMQSYSLENTFHLTSNKPEKSLLIVEGDEESGSSSDCQATCQTETNQTNISAEAKCSFTIIDTKGSKLNLVEKEKSNESINLPMSSNELLCKNATDLLMMPMCSSSITITNSHRILMELGKTALQRSSLLETISTKQDSADCREKSKIEGHEAQSSSEEDQAASENKVTSHHSGNSTHSQSTEITSDEDSQLQSNSDEDYIIPNRSKLSTKGIYCLDSTDGITSPSTASSEINQNKCCCKIPTDVKGAISADNKLKPKVMIKKPVSENVADLCHTDSEDNSSECSASQMQNYCKIERSIKDQHSLNNVDNIASNRDRENKASRLIIACALKSRKPSNYLTEINMLTCKHETSSEDAASDSSSNYKTETSSEESVSDKYILPSNYKQSKILEKYEEASESETSENQAVKVTTSSNSSYARKGKPFKIKPFLRANFCRKNNKATFSATNEENSEAKPNSTREQCSKTEIPKQSEDNSIDHRTDSQKACSSQEVNFPVPSSSSSIASSCNVQLNSNCSGNKQEGSEQPAKSDLKKKSKKNQMPNAEVQKTVDILTIK